MRSYRSDHDIVVIISLHSAITSSPHLGLLRNYLTPTADSNVCTNTHVDKNEALGQTIEEAQWVVGFRVWIVDRCFLMAYMSDGYLLRLIQSTGLYLYT